MKNESKMNETSNRFRSGGNGKWGYIDKEGKMVIKPQIVRQAE